MSIFKLLLLSLVFAIIFIFLKNIKSEYSILFELSVIVILSFVIISGADDFFDYIEEILSLSKSDLSFIKILLKALLISIVSDFASSFCRDCQSESLSKGVDLIGRTAILMLSLPIVKEFIEMIIGIM